MTPSISHPDLHESDLQRYGYVQLEVKGCRAVVLDWAASTVATALTCGTLHEWAALQPVREELHGRGVIYSVDLPTIPATPVVVRRNRHGGLLHGFTGEYFLSPTRAPLELSTSLRLAAAGVPTPEVIAYAIYPTGGVFARSDVMTRRLPEGDDLPAAWKKESKEECNVLLAAVARLLNLLAAAGAWHADLNLKNIYITRSGADRAAYLLDVDRVTFPGGDDVAVRNFKRLVRSARKWRDRWGLDLDENSLAYLADLTGENI
ncbi:MAG: lipopolysaccharide kinase InaA family protein [Desulfuromonadaceae bacterium]|nr:lipopolysaccharide kinase InaA family protein [Desulfuromonadaceae bacterium]